MFWARLSMDGNYLVAKKGPKVEFKIIEGAEMLNNLLDYDMFWLKIEYSSENETKSGRVDIDETFESLTKGYLNQEVDYSFSEVIGHSSSSQISAKTITYKLEFELNYKESGAGARPILLSLDKRMSENLYLNSDFSDIKILCEDKIFYCHKVILSSQSEVFRSMLTNVDMVEASSGEIKIVDFAASVMETLLYYLYNFDHGRLPGM